MNEIVHFGMGVLIAGAFGFRGKARLGLALFAAIPDWDVLTTPLVPWLLDTLDLPHAQGRALAIGLGHGAFSHSLLGVGLVFALAVLFRLRGRALQVAAVALVSHWLLDTALTWKVWFLLPFSQAGASFGYLTIDDPVVTLGVAGLAIATLAPEAISWWRSRRGRRAIGVPGWLPVVALLLAALIAFAPAAFKGIVASRYADTPGTRVFAVEYTSFVVIEPVGETAFQLTFADAFGGVLGEKYVDIVTDTTNATPGAREAVATLRRAVADMGPTSPLSVPVFTVRDAPEGLLLVEVREVRQILTSEYLEDDEIGLDFEMDREGRVIRARVTQGGVFVDAPREILPSWVELAPTPPE